MQASKELLDSLHNLVGRSLADEIKRYGEGGDLAGEPLPAALIGQAIKFLKDNGIEALPTENNGLGDLVDQMPELDDEVA